MTATQTRDTTDLTILKLYLSRDGDEQFIAAAVARDTDYIRQVATSHGWPDRAAVQQAVDGIETHPAIATRSAATVRAAPPPPPPARQPARVSWDLLLQTAADSEDPTAGRLYATAHSALTKLRDYLAAETERDKARAELAVAQRALDAARARARQLGVRPSKARRNPPQPRPSGRGRQIDYDAKQVRAWAAANNIDCPARGRYLPQAVIDQWKTTQDT